MIPSRPDTYTGELISIAELLSARCYTAARDLIKDLRRIIDKVPAPGRFEAEAMSTLEQYEDKLPLVSAAR